MNPNTSTALLWGGFALILLGFGGCVASGGIALSGAMDPRVYDTSIRLGAGFLQISSLMMFVGFVAVLVGAIGKAAAALNSRNGIDQQQNNERTSNQQAGVLATSGHVATRQQRHPGHNPDRVKAITAIHYGDRCEVSWAAAEGATSYRVSYRTADQIVWTIVASNHLGTTYTLYEADENATYIFAVIAVNEVGESLVPASARASRIDQQPINEQPTSLPPTTRPRLTVGPLPSPSRVRHPDNVEEVIAYHNGNEVEVLWDAAERATSYKVAYRTSEEAIWTNVKTSHIETTYILTEADEGATYTFAVIAVNKFGESGWTISEPASR